jgi:hypothetical protein
VEIKAYDSKIKKKEKKKNKVHYRKEEEQFSLPCTNAIDVLCGNLGLPHHISCHKKICN